MCHERRIFIALVMHSRECINMVNLIGEDLPASLENGADASSCSTYAPPGFCVSRDCSVCKRAVVASSQKGIAREHVPRFFQSRAQLADTADGRAT